MIHTGYSIISALMFLWLGAIWSNRGWKNVSVKMLCYVLAALGLEISLGVI
jgi:ABC-type branched-subunit amino acid transport system permease subunit